MAERLMRRPGGDRRGWNDEPDKTADVFPMGRCGLRR